MSLSKTKLSFILTLFLIFSNFWIYKIFNENFLVGVALITITFLIYLFKQTNHSTKLLVFLVGILLALQLQITGIRGLTKLNDDQVRIQHERMESYPPLYLDLKLKVIWLKPAHWIEENNTIIALSVIQNNFFETIDINRYFFGGYPRNNAADFEKFPFTLLPLFLIGIYKLISNKKFNILFILFGLPLLLSSMIGSSNLGVFSLFPFFIISFDYGVKAVSAHSKVWYLLFISITILGFILQLSYVKT